MKWCSFILLFACSSTEKEPVSGDVTAPVDADNDGFIASEDCDDNNSLVNASAEEICDGVDNNCDGQIDEGVLTTFYADSDGDGYGSTNISMDSCSAGEGFVSVGSDCDDSDADSYPGAEELCDGVDNNCDGNTDEDLGLLFYVDNDGDGFGDDSNTVEACTLDLGLSTLGGDCNDNDASYSPLAVELCDGMDNNCDGQIDEGATTRYYLDSDGDGYGDENSTQEACEEPEGYVAVAEDCDDSESFAHPSAFEICDGIDNNCDGDVDESGSAGEQIFYEDYDGDGYGNATTTLSACSQPSGYAADGTDCNDTEGSIYPGASEYCNSVDDDCDGDIDEASALDVLTWNIDYDGDGYGSSNYTLAQCSQPPGYVSDSTDCDDLNGAVFPGAAEVCNEVDDDCNGSIDDGATIDRQTFYEDQDGDGYGVASATTESCDAPIGYAELSGDCDDDNVDISPAAQESCNSVDDDCDGVIDESDAIDATLFYADDDTDGYGDAASSILSCVNPNGYVEDATDCDDADADVSPVAQELCNGIDDNCSGVIDDPTLLPSSTYYEDADEDGYGGSSTMLACSLPSGYSAIGNDCDDNDTALNPLTGCAQDCAEILQYGFATDGNYVIDPDGIGNGLDPFAVYCDMTTDGGGWIQMALSSAGNDRVYSTNPDDSNRGTSRSGDQARYYNHLSSDGFDGGDFLHYAYSTAPNMTEFDISYLNAATGADFSDAELDALRVVVTELSEDTLMVAGGVDDSCYYGSTFHSFDGQGHEIYISDGDGANFILLTYGTQTDDEQDAFYFYHTSTQLTTAENVIMGCGSDTEITHLEPQYLLPAKIQLGWASTDNAQWGGAAYWGSEWDYFLVR